MKGVVFEDNLSSHKTRQVLRFWEDILPNFIGPQFIPANLTEAIQVIDRHIGIMYKRAVYFAVRCKYLKRLNEARDVAGNADGITIRALTPREKQIIITKAIGDCHARLTDYLNKTYFRAFIATGTWLPISHLSGIEAEGPSVESLEARLSVQTEGPAVVPEELHVSIQHFKKYSYPERITREKVLAAVKEAVELRQCKLMEKEQQMRAIREGRQAQLAGKSSLLCVWPLSLSKFCFKNVSLLCPKPGLSWTR